MPLLLPYAGPSPALTALATALECVNRSIAESFCLPREYLIPAPVLYARLAQLIDEAVIARRNWTG